METLAMDQSRQSPCPDTRAHAAGSLSLAVARYVG
jgi:hypothetical protein